MKNTTTKKILIGLAIGGALFGATAAAISVSKTDAVVAESIVQPAPTEKASSIIAEAQPAETLDAPSMEAEPLEVDAKRPIVALPTEHRDVDHQAMANEALESGDLRGAFDSLRRHLYVKSPSASVLIEISRLGRSLKEHAIAEQACFDAAALEPEEADVQVELARVYLDMGELEDARFAARQAIRADTDNPFAWNLAGRANMALSQWDRAADAFENAIELDPLNGMFHNNMGLLRIHEKDGIAAVDHLETAVELFEEDAPHFVYNNLGLAHELSEHHEEAREAFEQALVINPFYSRAKVNLRRLETTIATIEEQKAFQTATGASVLDLTEEDLLDGTISDDG